MDIFVHRFSSIFKNTPANEMLTGLKYFERPIKVNSAGVNPKSALSWGVVDMDALARCILVICQQILDIVSIEPRLVKLESPTYILGKSKNFSVLSFVPFGFWQYLNQNQSYLGTLNTKHVLLFHARLRIYSC